jgi:exodeoxyribonuclease V alpha subunit
MERLSKLRQYDGFEAIDCHLAEFLQENAIDAPPSFALLVALLSRATRQGHVCLELSRYAGGCVDDFLLSHSGKLANATTGQTGSAQLTLPNLDSLLTLLRKTGVVGAPHSNHPIILDGERLYLERYFRHEHALARRLIERLGTVRKNAEPSLIRDVLSRWFAGAPELAKRAAAIAVTRRLCVLAGGPGTGKTSTVVRLLGAIGELTRRTGGSLPRTLLLAPTGKAASRLSESIMNAQVHLAQQLPEVESLPTEAMTVHRALSQREHSRAGQPQPLFADLIVVDEASMVDLSTMRQLFESATFTERVILLGDPHQLASVEAGAVLGDVCGVADGKYAPTIARELEVLTGGDISYRENDVVKVSDVVVELVESHRFKGNSGIGRLAVSIRKGDVEGVFTAFETDDGELEFLELGDVTFEHLSDRIWGKFKGLRDAEHPKEALAALERFRVLCVHRRGRFGVDFWNDKLEVRALSFEQSRNGRSLARPILIAENAEDGSLYNGDLGVLLAESLGRPRRGYFHGANGQINAFASGRLPPFTRAFAMSVHKSQGSEIEEVLVLLPPASSPLLTRELLYTAVTRAKKRCIIVGSKEALTRAVEQRIHRQSGLTHALLNLGAAP